ncbi:MAG: dephospho-CoA kinase [Candidatus Peribacteraceae bacterium]|nr:dephospho-CoA kinase [Candidatus Peribacteraceae bacterium]
MILWLTGNTGSGKTTLANKLKSKNTIILDGDEIRDVLGTDGKLSKEERWEHNIRIAKLAKLLESQGIAVIVSVIAPFEDLRREIKTICNCHFIHVDRNNHIGDKERPYEIPNNAVITVKGD